MKPKRNKKRLLKNSLVAYAFMAPALILLIIFVFYPIAFGIPLAFFDYSVVGDTKFIGWGNFTHALHDQQFWIALKNSITFVLVVIPIQVLSIMLAVLVNRKIPGIKYFRALYYIPVVTSMVAVSITWGFIFDPNGVINSLLISKGIIKQPILFLGDPKLALFSLMFVTMWQGLGYYMMLYLAGLQSIPQDVEEAALVDGANKVQALFKIKLPLLKPYVWFCSLLSVLSAVSVFDVVFVLTNGGPYNSTLVINLYSYNKAFLDFDFGYSSAIGLLMSVITMLLSILIFMYGRKGGINNY